MSILQRPVEVPPLRRAEELGLPPPPPCRPGSVLNTWMVPVLLEEVEINGSTKRMIKSEEGKQVNDFWQYDAKHHRRSQAAQARNRLPLHSRTGGETLA